MILRIGLFSIVGGLCFMVTALNTGHLGWGFLAGVLLAAAFVPVARFGPQSLFGQFGAMALVLVVVGLVCTVSEALIFFPEMKLQLSSVLAGGGVIYLLIALVLASVSKLLKIGIADDKKVPRRPAALAVPLLLLSGLSYVLFYLVFGEIAFQFFTKQYYPHAVEQVMAMGAWFWLYQFGRGLLMTLAVLPVIYTLRLPRWQAALAVGALLWIAGGGASLLVPSPQMVAAQRYEHIIEIFTQNFSLGVVAVCLLRQKAAAVQPALVNS